MQLTVSKELLLVLRDSQFCLNSKHLLVITSDKRLVFTWRVQGTPLFASLGDSTQYISFEKEWEDWYWKPGETIQLPQGYRKLCLKILYCHLWLQGQDSEHLTEAVLDVNCWVICSLERDCFCHSALKGHRKWHRFISKIDIFILIFSLSNEWV